MSHKGTLKASSFLPVGCSELWSPDHVPSWPCIRRMERRWSQSQWIWKKPSWNYTYLMLNLLTLVFSRLETVIAAFHKNSIEILSSRKNVDGRQRVWMSNFETKHNQMRVNWSCTLKRKPLLFYDKERLHYIFTANMYLTHFLRPRTCTVIGSAR